MNSQNIFDVQILGLPSVQALENGQIIYIPEHRFTLDDHQKYLFDEKILAPNQKNISYDPIRQQLSGVDHHFQKTPRHQHLLKMMQQFNAYAADIVQSFFPNYVQSLRHGRTSYRPAEIKDRPTSVLKDDTRLHVDAFPFTPVQGHRILRIFSNINPHQIPRVWQVGESFSNVLSQFHPHLKPYSPIKSYFMYKFGFTASKRTAYDHFMLQLHNQMKYSQNYQETVHKETIAFPSHCTWIVFTDQVSHAALSGQFLLEQTFYVPVQAMNDPTTSPLHHFQRVFPKQRMV